MLGVCIAMASTARDVCAQQATARDDGTRALAAALPKSAGAFRRFETRQLDAHRQRVIDRAVSIAVFGEGAFGSPSRAAGNVRMVEQITATKDRIDAILNDTIALRSQFARLPAGADRREAIRRFLDPSMTFGCRRPTGGR